MPLPAHRAPYYAAHAAVARYECRGMGGYCVRLAGNGLTKRYVHLTSYTINDGERLLAGQAPGRVATHGRRLAG